MDCKQQLQQIIKSQCKGCPVPAWGASFLSCFHLFSLFWIKLSQSTSIYESLSLKLVMWEILQDRSFTASANSTTDLIHYSQLKYPAAKPIRAEATSVCTQKRSSQLTRTYVYPNWIFIHRFLKSLVDARNAKQFRPKITKFDFSKTFVIEQDKKKKQKKLQL